jgi:nitrile hydratase beta subunit
MSRPNDIGGLAGFGSVNPEPEAQEPVFHADWERRTFGMLQATRGHWSIDMFRAARERDDRAEYLRRSYFENWLVGFERLAVEYGLVTAEELATGRAAAIPDQQARERLLAPKAGLFPPIPPSDQPAQFRIGERVRAVDREPRGHTRQPGYTRGRVGVVVEYHGAHRFPDLAAEGVVEGQHLYTVRFDARELWDERAAGGGAVLVDLWEDYLERAE